jgi:hypothetical protein
LLCHRATTGTHPAGSSLKASETRHAPKQQDADERRALRRYGVVVGPCNDRPFLVYTTVLLHPRLTNHHPQSP